MTPILRAGIIAAGDGVRLQPAQPGVPKPLVQAGGRPLAEWIVSSLRDAGVRSMVMLLNSRGRPVREHLKARFPDIQWAFLEKDTVSSWESFRLVSRALAAASERFLLGTVDALIPQGEACRFAQAAAGAMLGGHDAALALTRFVDDEKPLWAQLDPSGRVLRLGAAAKAGGYVTCGLYALTRGLAEAMPEPNAYGRLRDYWGSAVESGRRVLGVPLSKTLDVDRPEDLAAADAFARSLGGSRP